MEGRPPKPSGEADRERARKSTDRVEKERTRSLPPKAEIPGQAGAGPSRPRSPSAPPSTPLAFSMRRVPIMLEGGLEGVGPDAKGSLIRNIPTVDPAAVAKLTLLAESSSEESSSQDDSALVGHAAESKAEPENEVSENEDIPCGQKMPPSPAAPPKGHGKGAKGKKEDRSLKKTTKSDTSIKKIGKSTPDNPPKKSEPLSHKKTTDTGSKKKKDKKSSPDKVTSKTQERTPETRDTRDQRPPKKRSGVMEQTAEVKSKKLSIGSQLPAKKPRRESDETGREKGKKKTEEYTSPTHSAKRKTPVKSSTPVKVQTTPAKRPLASTSKGASKKPKTKGFLEDSESEVEAPPAKSKSTKEKTADKKKAAKKDSRVVSTALPGQIWPKNFAEVITMKIGAKPNDLPRKYYPVLKCPYCIRFLTQKRIELWRHIDANHEKELRDEEHGLFSACRRIEHINGAGCRVLDLEKASKHWDTVREVFDGRQRRALRTISMAIQAESNGLIGDETCPLQSNFKNLRKVLEKMYLKEPYLSERERSADSDDDSEGGAGDDYYDDGEGVGGTESEHDDDDDGVASNQENKSDVEDEDNDVGEEEESEVDSSDASSVSNES